MKKNKQILNIIILLLITGLVLYFSLKNDFSTILNEIIHVNIIWLMISFVLIFAFWLLKAIATMKIVKIFHKGYKFKQAFCLILETNFFHAITPFAVGGQPYEIYSLKKSNLKITDATNSSISSFIVYQIALVLLGIFALIYNHQFQILPNNHFLNHLVTIGFIINFIVIVALFLLTFAKKINQFVMKLIVKLLNKLKIVKNKEQKIEQFNQYLNEFHTGAKILFQNKKQFIFLILIHMLGLVCLYTIPFTLSHAMEIYEFNVIDAVAVSAYVMLIGSFVPIPGGTGGLEYGFIAFYGNFIKGGKLNALMLIWRFITYYFGIILGSVLLGFRKKDKK